MLKVTNNISNGTNNTITNDDDTNKNTNMYFLTEDVQRKPIVIVGINYPIVKKVLLTFRSSQAASSLFRRRPRRAKRFFLR